jgi:hypothetical protein
MRKAVAMAVMAAMLTTGCASATRTQMAVAPQPSAVAAAAMADYVGRLPPGSKVRVERIDGKVMHATLLKAAPDAIVVQRNTRVPEPPVEVPLGQIARVTVDNGGGTSTAKAVAIGIATGVGAFFAILAIAVASIDD